MGSIRDALKAGCRLAKSDTPMTIEQATKIAVTFKPGVRMRPVD
jgi:hypothetical protein